jgi:alpha-L-rhamnosidase
MPSDRLLWNATAVQPVLSTDIYAGEQFDARLVAKGWDQPGFDTAGWEPVTKLNASSVPLSAKMSVHGFAPIKIVSAVHPVNVTETAAGSGKYLVWFPANVAGVLQLVNVAGAAGTTITLSHGEQLKDATGNVCLVGCWGKGTSKNCIAARTSNIYTVARHV